MNVLQKKYRNFERSCKNLLLFHWDIKKGVKNIINVFDLRAF